MINGRAKIKDILSTGIIVYLRRECLLQHGEETVRLATHGHGQAEVLHTVLNVPGGEQLLAQLHLLQEEPLHRLLVREVRQTWLLPPACLAPPFLPSLAQFPSEVGMTAALPAKHS